MRYKRLIAVFLAAVFLLGAAVPAIAEDGRRQKLMDVVTKDNPWQDDKAGDKGKKTLTIVIGPAIITIKIAIPFTQRPSQAPVAPVNNTTTQSTTEKGK
jgi:hypothetical protein